MSKQLHRQRIGLTVDPDLWERCRAKSKLYGINWSEVAEQAFTVLLLELEKIEAIVASSYAGQDSLPILKSSLKSHLADHFAHSYKEIEELSISKSKILSKST